MPKLFDCALRRIRDNEYPATKACSLTIQQPVGDRTSFTQVSYAAIEFCLTPLLHSGKKQPSLPSSTRANRLSSVPLLAYPAAGGDLEF